MDCFFYILYNRSRKELVIKIKINIKNGKYNN